MFHTLSPIVQQTLQGSRYWLLRNHHTYWSLAEWNYRTRRYAAVVYGAGKASCSSGLALEEAIRECRAEGAHYFGDIDPAGISIPLRFNQQNIVTVQPAVDLYQITLSVGRKRAPVIRLSADTDMAQEWLAELSDEISALWAAGFWIPQESLGTEQLVNLPGPAGEKSLLP